ALRHTRRAPASSDRGGPAVQVRAPHHRGVHRLVRAQCCSVQTDAGASRDSLTSTPGRTAPCGSALHPPTASPLVSPPSPCRSLYARREVTSADLSERADRPRIASQPCAP